MLRLCPPGGLIRNPVVGCAHAAVGKRVRSDALFSLQHLKVYILIYIYISKTIFSQVPLQSSGPPASTVTGSPSLQLIPVRALAASGRCTVDRFSTTLPFPSERKKGNIIQILTLTFLCPIGGFLAASRDWSVVHLCSSSPYKIPPAGGITLSLPQKLRSWAGVFGSEHKWKVK